jgi:hypothetical protein
MEEGRFSIPPKAVHEGNRIKFPLWPEAEYLLRVARSDPAQAGRALLAIGETDNMRVHLTLAQIALIVPPNDAAQWALGEAQWVRKQDWLMPGLTTSLASLASRLFAEGQPRAGEDLTRAVFEVLPDRTKDARATSDFPLPPQPRARSDSWEFDKAIETVRPQLTDSMGLDGLGLLSDLLDDALRLSRMGGDEARPMDYSFIWREAIERDEEAHREIRDILVSAVRDAAGDLAERVAVKKVTALLEERGWRVFRRIAIHVVRQWGGGDPALLRDYLLSEQLFDAVDVRHEWALLLEDHFAKLAASEQERILLLVEKGPDRAAMRERHLRASGEALPKELEEQWVEQWQRDRLSPIHKVLPAPWGARFDDFVQRHGPPQFDRNSSVVTVRWGDRSPVKQDDIVGMSSDQLHSFLREWSPERGFDTPTREGVVDTLSGLGDALLQREVQVAERWAGLHPVYVRFLLRGAQQLLRNGGPVAWDRILGLLELLEIDIATSEGAAVCSAAMALLRDGFDAGSGMPAVTLKERLWQFIENSMRKAEALPVVSDLLSAGDALHRSMNSVHGQSVEAAIRLGVWAKRMSADVVSEFSFSQRLPRVSDALDKWLRARTGQSLLARPMFGANLEALSWLDHSWVSSRLSILFPDEVEHEAFREAVWETFLVYGRAYGRACEDYATEYRREVERLRLDEHTQESRRRVAEHLAEHLSVYFWRRQLDLAEDGLLRGFYALAPAELRGHVLAFVGRSLQEAEDVPADTVRRLFEILEWRESFLRGLTDATSRRRESGELRQVGYWCSAPALSGPQLLPHIKAALELAGGVESEKAVAEKLAEWVAVSPMLVAESVELLILNRAKEWSLHYWRPEVEAVVRSLNASSDPPQQERARRIVELLVERGFHDARSLTQ